MKEQKISCSDLLLENQAKIYNFFNHLGVIYSGWFFIINFIGAMQKETLWISFFLQFLLNVDILIFYNMVKIYLISDKT